MNQAPFRQRPSPHGVRAHGEEPVPGLYDRVARRRGDGVFRRRGRFRPQRRRRRETAAVHSRARASAAASLKSSSRRSSEDCRPRIWGSANAGPSASTSSLRGRAKTRPRSRIRSSEIESRSVGRRHSGDLVPQRARSVGPTSRRNRLTVGSHHARRRSRLRKHLRAHRIAEFAPWILEPRCEMLERLGSARGRES